MKNPLPHRRSRFHHLALSLLAAGGVGTVALTAAEVAPAPPTTPASAASPAAAPEADSNRDPLAQVHQELTRAGAAAVHAADMVRHQVGMTHFSFNGPNSSRTLIVPRADITEEQLADVQEELTIMSRILAKATDPEASGHGGFRFKLAGFGFGGGSDLDALYLEGYGAVFLLDVDYPLVEPPKNGEKKAAPRGDKDPTWEKTRRELAGTPGGDEELLADDTEADPGAAFDADRVAALRKRLIESFRHAANLKALKEGGDRVTFVVSGHGAGIGMVHLGGGTTATGNVMGYVKDNKGVKVVDMRSRKSHSAQQLTLTARKGDIDSFAAGRLTPDEFARKVTGSTLDKIPTVRP